jgi:glycosyltransferase domain-containing protein
MNRADQKQIAIDWEKMQHLSELTIVVPTYTRQMDALQQMHFWSSSPVELYVLDGTSEPISNKYLKNLGKNIHYINMQRSVEERFCFVLDKIKTPYVAVSSDDEFFIPSALESCIDYLKERKEFIACIGRVMAFHLSKKGMVAKQMYGAMKNYKIENETAAERMLAHMNPYMYTSVHAVQCTDVWKKSIKIIGINENPLSCPYAPELQVELATCYQGKSAVIEKLMWLRNKENKVISDRAYDRNLQLYEWFKKKKYEGEVELFYEITSEELARIGG